MTSPSTAALSLPASEESSSLALPPPDFPLFSLSVSSDSSAARLGFCCFCLLFPLLEQCATVSGIVPSETSLERGKQTAVFLSSVSGPCPLSPRHAAVGVSVASAA
uniref:Phosphatidylinositol transfer protein n=1 Tax=Toxoplasma gondii COUG TaxID=1074873 RepID=A0A2G8Y2Z5_TOXGO|nr:phosphatidylinositol transfer protein [Toxoplasma gondii COUG]